MRGMRAGDLDRRVRIERPIADEAIDGAGSGPWELVAEIWAQVQDVPPSRGERIANGISAVARQTRVRMRYRADVTPDMRIVMGGRIMQIVSMPAELGRRVGIEVMVEDYRPAGNPA